MTTLYGQTESEKRAQENKVCRDIVSEINNFGVTQRQIMVIIYLLASELENVENMRAITRTVRERGGEDLFIIGNPEPDREMEEGDNNGSSNV